MKIPLYKGLAYLGTAGVAATTVLLTASSVGLKKSKSDTFPSLSGLIQNRPEVKEELLAPEDAPKPPPSNPPGGNPPPGGQPNPADPATGSQPDDAAQSQPKGPDGAEPQQPNGAQGSPGGGGAQGGTSGGLAGGMDCTMENLQNFNVDPTYLLGVHGTVTSLSSCVNTLLTQSQPVQSQTIQPNQVT